MARAHGIDISKYQVDFDATVKPDDIDFIIMRTSYGLMVDERYNELLEAIKPIPIRGAYHYFSSGSPWQKQADHFLPLVKDMGFHFYALDVESKFNQQSAGFAEGARKWLQHVFDTTGITTILYSNPNVYSYWLTPYGDWMSSWPLWIAQYWFEPSRDKNPGLPAGVTEWKIWQYSADIPPNNKGREYGVKSLNIDLNVYNGTVEDLRWWLKLDEEQQTDETEEE